jgi:hypothetical protein
MRGCLLLPRARDFAEQVAQYAFVLRHRIRVEIRFLRMVRHRLDHDGCLSLDLLLVPRLRLLGGALRLQNSRCEVRNKIQGIQSDLPQYRIEELCQRLLLRVT